MSATAPAPVLRDATLYLGDNGACLCGACSGASARYTGRDLSGAPVEPVSPADALQAARLYGVALRCESCGRDASGEVRK